MRLRILLIALSVLAFFSTAMGGYIYFSGLKESAFIEAEHKNLADAARVNQRVTNLLDKNMEAVKALAGMPTLKKALVEKNPASLDEVNRILDNFKQALNASVCYLMNRDGLTVAASNRFSPDSFVGQNYSFRPYFTAAISGESNVYMALGVTSKRRGIYYSHPVTNASGLPIGVAIIKAGITDLEEALTNVTDGVMLLTDPHGIVFAANAQNWLFRSLWDLSPEAKRKIAESEQFGPGPWPNVGLKSMAQGRVVDASGQEYLIYERSLPDHPGWSIVYLRDLQLLNDSITRPIIHSVGIAAIAVAIFIGLAVLLLYRRAVRELSSRRETETALRESEMLYRTIVDYSHDGIIMINENYRFTYVNDEFCRILVRGREEIIGRDFRDFLDAESIAMVSDHYRRRQAGEEVPQRYEFNIVRPTGAKRRLETSSTVIRDARGRPTTVAQMLDVTERRQAEEALKESEEKYRTILESIDEGYFEADADGRLTFANDALCRIMRRPLERLVGLHYSDYTHPDAVDSIVRRISRIYESNRPAKVFDHRVITGDGEVRVLQGSISLRADKDGHSLGIRGVARDVTEQRLQEMRLRESEERYRSLLEANPDPVILYDTKGQVVYFNPAFTNVFGWSLEECKGRTMGHFVPEETLGETRMMLNMLRSGQNFSGVETKRFNKSGDIVPVNISGAVFKSPDGKFAGSIINLRDIRRQKELEMQLQQAQKMEAIGTLASGIAHDFNNLLQAASGQVQLMLSKTGEDQPLGQHLYELDLALERASDLVQRLLTFSRKVKIELRALDLNQQVQQTIAMVHRTIPKMVNVDQRLADGLGLINGDAHQLGHLLMNLITNARDAMPEGGTLTIETADQTIEPAAESGSSTPPEGRYVRLSVIDTGHGMDDKTKEHIFEPFFTTKPLGAGTGLGLSTIYGIVKSHNGYIDFQSDLGKGTRFDILFPVVQDPALVEPQPPEQPIHLQGAGETILIVDDERAIRNVAREFLAGLGFAPITAESGERALEIFKKNPKAITLVILDLGMPGMGGAACLRDLHEIDPEVKVIIASGYSQDDPGAQAVKPFFKNFIHKPYRLNDLARIVFEALAEDQPINS
jgi:two-component system cell cycle sensor histidine kinase/response regulator CckA